MKSIIYQIPDMQSDHCQVRVSKAVKSISGVTIEHIEPKQIKLSMQDETAEELITAAIENAGYRVTKVESDPSSEHHDSVDEVFQFKTNVNCGGCVAKLTNVFNETDGICHFDVDIKNPDKILTVHSDGITEPEIINAVKKAGFTIERINDHN